MKYMGSKNRIAKEILPIMLEEAEKYGVTTWVEPFVGGANMIDKVPDSFTKIGADINPYLIKALILIRDSPEKIPNLITEDHYQMLKKHMNVDGITGFVGFSMSFGGKFFGGYRRDKAGTKGCLENMKTQSISSKKSALKQSPLLQDVRFINESYLDLRIPDNSLIYCDPPYEGTTKYKNDFNHAIFWNWCRDMSRKGHRAFISEYKAPYDFECVWEKKINSSLAISKGRKAVEKLFRPCTLL